MHPNNNSGRHWKETLGKLAPIFVIAVAILLVSILAMSFFGGGGMQNQSSNAPIVSQTPAPTLEPSPTTEAASPTPTPTTRPTSKPTQTTSDGQASLLGAPSQLTPDDCTQVPDPTTEYQYSYNCAIKFQSSPSSSGPYAWQIKTDLANVSFDRSSGSLAPGESVAVKASIPCQSGSIYVDDSRGSIAAIVNWICPSKVVVLDQTNLSPTICPRNGAVYHCTIVLTLEDQTQVYATAWWKVATKPSNVVVRPDNVILMHVNQAQQVTIDIPVAGCIGWYAIFFLGPQNVAKVIWNCPS